MSERNDSVEISATDPGCWMVVGQLAGRERVLGHLRWSGDRMLLSARNGAVLGVLYRSDGKYVNRTIKYRWRACLPGPDGAEVTRRATQPDAVCAILAAYEGGSGD
jgi:hypothetical protein